MTLLIFAIETFFLTMWTYGLRFVYSRLISIQIDAVFSVPGGIFIPLLLCGAAWGRLIGLGVDKLFPIMV